MKTRRASFLITSSICLLISNVRASVAYHNSTDGDQIATISEHHEISDTYNSTYTYYDSTEQPIYSGSDSYTDVSLDETDTFTVGVGAGMDLVWNDEDSGFEEDFTYGSSADGFWEYDQTFHDDSITYDLVSVDSD